MEVKNQNSPLFVSGPLTASMIAAARCLSHPSFKIQALLRAVLRDEMIAWHKKNSDTSQQAGATSEAGAAAPPQVVQTDIN